MTDDRIPFLKFKQYAVTVEYKIMTPRRQSPVGSKELAEKIKDGLQYSGATALWWRDDLPRVVHTIFSNLPTILAALEAYDKIESFADWLALYPEDLRLANCKFRELFDIKPLPKPREGE